jgi:hypothetical protein
MATLVALVDVAAERGGSAERNISERSFLLNRERVSKPREISWTVEAGKCRPAPAPGPS